MKNKLLSKVIMSLASGIMLFSTVTVWGQIAVVPLLNIPASQHTGRVIYDAYSQSSNRKFPPKFFANRCLVGERTCVSVPVSFMKFVPLSPTAGIWKVAAEVGCNLPPLSEVRLGLDNDPGYQMKDHVSNVIADASGCINDVVVV